MKLNLRGKALAAMAILSTASLAACGGGTSSGGGDWHDDLVNPDELVIGTSANYAPYTMEQGGKVVGYSIDQCVELAKRLKLKPVIKVLDFNGVMTGLSTGQFDVACSGELLHTPERLKASGFFLAKPTMVDTTGLLTKSSNTRAKTFEDAKGKSVGGVQGGAQPAVVKNHFNGDVKLVLYPGLAEAVKGLKQGRTEFVTAGRLVLFYYKKQNPNTFRIVGKGVDPLPGSFAMAPKEPLRNALDKASQKMVTDGTIAKLQEKWFGTTSLPNDK